MNKWLVIILLLLLFSCNKFDISKYSLKNDERIVIGIGYSKEKLLSANSPGYKRAFKCAVQQMNWCKWYKKNNIIKLQIIPVTIKLSEIHKTVKMTNNWVKYEVYLKYKKNDDLKKYEEYTGYSISDYGASVAYDRAIKNALMQYIDKHNVKEGLFMVKKIIQFERKDNNFICRLEILCR